MLLPSISLTSKIALPWRAGKVIIGARFYLLHSGDLAFIRESLPAMERTLGYFIERRNPQGLFKLEDVGAHWYYDAITTGGINGYYNAFF